MAPKIFRMGALIAGEGKRDDLLEGRTVSVLLSSISCVIYGLPEINRLDRGVWTENAANCDACETRKTILKGFSWAAKRSG